MKELTDKIDAMVASITHGYCVSENDSSHVIIPVNMMGNIHELFLCSMARMQYLAYDYQEELPLPEFGTHYLWLSIYDDTSICVGVDEDADSILKAVSYIGFLAAQGETK